MTPTKKRPRWGRAAFQLICHQCRRTIEDGESIWYTKRFGEGILCAECGEKAEGKA